MSFLWRDPAALLSALMVRGFFYLPVGPFRRRYTRVMTWLHAVAQG